MGPLRGCAVALVVAIGASGCAGADPVAGPPAPADPVTSAPVISAPVTECGGTGSVRRTVAQYLDEPGADPDLTTLEVVRPATGPRCGPVPVVVWVHGGAWRTGDRRHQLDDKVELFTSMGWALISVNYRLTPAVQYPVHADDVAAAIGWTLDHADELGLDPERVSVMGHSAGAGIVASVATDPRHLGAVGRSPEHLRCAVVLDTEGYDVEAMAERGVRIYLDAFGDDPEVWRAASPMRHVAADAGIPPMLVVTRGSASRRAGAGRFVEALRAAGVSATSLDARPLTHAQVNAAVGAPGESVVTPVLSDFLRGC